MKVSVIIPTFNGAHRIGALLNALHNQVFQPLEVIVVIDGSVDNTLEFLTTQSSVFPDLKIIVKQNSGRSKARNNGAAEASGDIFVFYDDDMVPASDSLSKHVNFHLAKPGIVSGFPVDVFSKDNSDIQNYKAFISKRWFAKFNDGLSPLDRDNIFFTASNCSLKRADFFLLNGFDERLTDVEDHDLAIRALHVGLPVYFDKSNVAEHRDRISCKSYIKRRREYEAARMVKALNSTNKIEVSLWKRAVYSLAGLPIVATLIDKNFFLFIPRILRYKLYDIVIHSLSVLHKEREL